MGSVGAKSRSREPVSKSKEELKEELKQLRVDYMNFLQLHSDEEGNVEEDAIEELLRLQDKKDAVEYDLHKQLSPTVPAEKWNPNDITVLTYDDAQTVRKDMLKDEGMYKAIAKAQHGVAFEDGKTHDTPVDSYYKKNPQKVYDLFEPTRKVLSAKYGDTITLYRVPTSQTAKTTVNMTGTRKNAEQYAKIYNGRVEAIKVPVKDILAVNVSRTGGYEEFIVLNRRR